MRMRTDSTQARQWGSKRRGAKTAVTGVAPVTPSDLEACHNEPLDLFERPSVRWRPATGAFGSVAVRSDHEIEEETFLRESGGAIKEPGPGVECRLSQTPQ